ncbi:PSP1-domain-containing protein [Mucor ambiguus]|uniref:PSP1-domain-containing protein n=1 Tax=Mucor ambiguus TaxID=91626 RepID=A0A0C9MH11_9FUNG|nr:PSP1-domain-containing protein [Mucor ambiguus]
MSQQQQQQKTEDDSNYIGVPIINNPNPDNAWKAVGSPSRRGSTTTLFSDINKKSSPNESPVNDHVDIIRRSSVVSEGNNNNWGSFGGFQWEGPSIFDEDGKPITVPPTQPAPDDAQAMFNTNYDILSVPMLPGVSLEPIYRQQRSLSFSMGQDPTFFGYDDYDEHPAPQQQQQQQQNQYQSSFKSSLAPMEEEEDAYYDEFDHIRSRSKSSGAAFGLLSQNQHSRLMNNGHIRRGSEQQDDLLINQRRRSSSRFFNTNDPAATTAAATPHMSMGDKERLDILQRRLSQQQEYSFPDNLMRRQSLTLSSHPPSNIQQLADQLENTHLRTDLPNLSAFQPPPPPPQSQQTQYRSDLYAQHLQQQPLFNNGPLPYHPSAAATAQQQSQQQQQPHHPSQQQHHYQQQQRQAQNQHQQQQAADDYFDTDPRGFQDLGKGIPVHRLDPNVPLYMVEFKGGRTDFFYVIDSNQFHPQLGDLVIVEADRGKDLGKVACNTLTIDQVTVLEQKKQAQLQQLENNDKEKEKDKEAKEEETPAKAQRELHVKRIFRLAAPDEVNLLLVKGQDEHKALVVCQQKTKQRKLPMEVVDAEYQWDRRKLTFYFEAENRIDFRELVRELFKIYKTRIWMCVVTAPITIDDINNAAASTTTFKNDM